MVSRIPEDRQQYSMLLPKYVKELLVWENSDFDVCKGIVKRLFPLFAQDECIRIVQKLDDSFYPGYNEKKPYNPLEALFILSPIKSYHEDKKLPDTLKNVLDTLPRIGEGRFLNLRGFYEDITHNSNHWLPRQITKKQSPEEIAHCLKNYMNIKSANDKTFYVPKRR